MAFVEKTGKTVEEAVAAALKELNVTADDVVVEVLQEAKSGFLGFFGKDAKVRVTVKETEAVAAVADAPVKTVNEAVENAVDAVKEAAEVAVEAVSAKAVEVKDSAIDSAVSALESLKEEPKVEKEAPKAKENGERPVREPRKYVVNDEAVLVAKEFLQRVFKAMKIEVAMEKFINKNDGSVTFKLHGADMGILIGKHGQTLDSLQYLTNLVANKNSSDRVRVIIDVEDYRDRRIETLNRLASRLADKVKRTGERVALEPMNPHERKIIHMALQGDRRVTTLSEGDEPYRHVVIELKK